MRKSHLVVVGLLIAEAVLCAASLGKYFCGDSLYFFSHIPDGSAAWLKSFTHLDDLSTYRPLTLVIFRYLMLPLGGFSPWPYHLMAIAAHLGVTVLVYFLLKRLATSEAGLLAGIAFFALHSVGFYLSYDATFLPDFSTGLLTAGALLAHAYGRRRWSLALFIVALFCKESAIAIPIGLAVVGWLAARENPLKTMRPHGLVAAIYLALQSLLHGGWLYPGAKSAYRFAMGPSDLWLKLKYIPWLFNLPADWSRQRWWMIPAIVAMIPVIVWAWRNWRGDGGGPGGGNASNNDRGTTLALCAAWAVAALAPALPVAQVPMKHNLYVPVIALAVAISRCIAPRAAADPKSPAPPLATPWAVLVLLFAATAFQVRNDLTMSWVGEGSDITGESVAAVLEAYPVLPHGARLYILPAKIPGGISWYFDDEAWFRHVYEDPKMQVYYADLKRLPPAGFAETGVLIFAFDAGRLWDVTSAYKQVFLDPAGRPLLPQFDRATVTEDSARPAATMLDGRAAGVLSSRNGEQLVILPGARVSFPIDAPLPPDAVLVAGVSPMGKQKEAARGRLLWGSTEVASVFLEQSDSIQSACFDLHRFAGQTGTLTFENTGGPQADWIAWNRLAVSSRQSLALNDISDYSARSGDPLLANIAAAPSETTIAWTEAEKPNGRVADMQLLKRGVVERSSLVVLPQTTVRIPVATLAPRQTLLVGAGSAGKQKGAAQGRLLWNEIEIARVFVDPGAESDYWWDGAIDLDRFAGQSGTLTIENTGARDSDWIAWNRLRIVPQSAGAPEVEAGARPLQEMSNPLLADFARASVATAVAWDAKDLAGGRAANLKLLTLGGEPHESLFELPLTDVQFSVSIPEHAHLSFVTSSAGLSEGAIDFDSEQIFHTYLDARSDGGRWQRHDVDLSKFAGRSGSLVFRNLAVRTRAAVAWASIHITVGDPTPAQSVSLFDLLSSAESGFDRSEVYPNYDHFDTPPPGKPFFVWWDNLAQPERMSLVTIAGTRLRYTFPQLPDRAALSFAVSHGTGVGDGVEGRIYWNDQLVYSRLIAPQTRDWSDAMIPLPHRAGGGGTLRIEVSSGPKHNAVGDWLAWSGLRIQEY